MFTNFKIALFTLLLSVSFRASAQYNCLFDHYSTEDGLSHGSVSFIFKDSKGFMWFATWDGINRFDGNEFKSYNIKPGANNSFSSNRVEAIIEDKRGVMWMRTYDAKVFRLNTTTEEFENILGDQNFDENVQIISLFSASNGDVWLSTRNSGIYRVVSKDDLSFHIIQYHTGGQNSILSNKVISVNEDATNNIWINSASGIDCFTADSADHDFYRKKFSATTQNIFSKYKISAFFSSAKFIYLGTENGGVIQYSLIDGTTRVIELPNKYAISHIVSRDEQVVYIGTLGAGVFEYSVDKNIVQNHYVNNQITKVYKLFPDSKGLLWIESSTIGFSKIDLKDDSYKHFEQLLDVNPDVRSYAQCGFIEDNDSTIWLILKGGGFGYYNRDHDEIEYFYNKPGDESSKLSNFVYCFDKDTNDVLWLSTYFKGIEKVTFLQKRFQFYQPSPESVNSIANEVRSVMHDKEGRLWIATKRQEIYLFNKRKELIRKITSANGKPIGLIYAMAEDSQGNVFVGTKGNGLFKFSKAANGEFISTHFKHIADDKYSISSNNIYSLLKDDKGRMWVGTYGGGLNMFDDGKFYNSSNTFSNYPVTIGKKVRHIAMDNKSNIWLATTDGVLFFDPNDGAISEANFYYFSKDASNKNSLSSNDVYWIYCDKQDAIWLATLGGGLNKLRNYPVAGTPLEFDIYTKENGLPSNVIFTIIADNSNNLWMSTENGITLFNRQDNVFHNYNKYDGIIKGGFSEGAASISSGGEICFGANNGFYCFDPATLTPVQKRVNLVFTSLQIYSQESSESNKPINKKSISDQESVVLNYDQNVLTIRWAGLDFSRQEQLRYSYMLEGFDSDWYHVSNSSSATYNKIPPGTYLFKVKFDNPELQALNKVKTFKIKIRPPYWRTDLAYVIFALLLVVLFVVVWRIAITIMRLRNKVIIENELTEIKLNFFTNISHELRTPLTLILGPAKELSNSETLSDKGVSYVSLIEENAKRMLRLVNQLLDFRKIQNRKMTLRLNEMDVALFVKMKCRNFEDLAFQKQIDFTFNSEVENEKLWFDEDKLDSVIFNLLSNAFKFTADNGSIAVTVLERYDNSICIEVRDNGVGVSKDKEQLIFKNFVSDYKPGNRSMTGTGIGLALSKELVALHGGELEYKRSASGGATFSVLLKKGTSHFNAQEVRLSESININEKVNIDNDIEDVDKNEIVNALPKVLIVEDNRDVRQFLSLQLDNLYVIDEAENGVQGLEKVKANQPDIILSDVMMPEMDGIEFLDQIKSNFDTSHIPVVLLTAKSSIESKIEGLKYGADAYIVKPFNTLQLKLQLENLLNQRTLLKEKYTTDNRLDSKLESLSVTDRDNQFLLDVRAIIEENIANVEFRIEFIYKQLGIGRTKFFLKLKGLTGLSPIDFVKEYRLNKALSFLQTDKYNITEVSYMAGYSDSGYFSKCFKERFGVLPSHYRKM